MPNNNVFKVKMEYAFMFNQDKNKKILEILKENSKLSTSKISKKTGIPITTVFNRIKKMEEEGIIKKYTLELNYKKLGKNILAFVFLIPNYDFLREKNLTLIELIEKITKNTCVEEAYNLTGRYDMFVKVRVSSIEELNDFILNILKKEYGITKTETMIVLSERR